ncbi:MAG: response regulator [Nitrolancea sp.]
MTDNYDNLVAARVLVVDDDASFVRRATVSLGTLADVECVTTGEELLHCVYRQLPDIVLLDMMLADRDGFLMLEELLRLNLEKPPFVICTTSGPLSINRLSTSPDWPVGTIARSSRMDQLRSVVKTVLASRDEPEVIAEPESVPLVAQPVAG